MPDPAAVAPDDRSLLSSLRQEPGRWMPAVLERYERPLLRHASSVLSDPAAAQDVVQECYLKLLANGQPVENLSAWLHRVTHNLAVDHLRAESRRQRLHAAAAQERAGAPTDDPLSGRTAQELVDGALLELSPNERAVLHLKLKADKSYREISAITGLSTSNVGYLIHQAVKKVASRLRAQGVRAGEVKR
jgi:RNA polymerase sigma-70 factor (ECF subfamily)